ncbi:kinase [Novosphingobium album (ex Hu et al. 2023)]|uniref:Kinase n=1 Tax=Novosphingobium album (ex Hu et al. 2023) TaxID=2930093 RepID=A0ABT0AX73_9SPHN|nr:kinase [Novosphingobium album (ex Hu et al. 2023)]MCJ2177428.1 kinase [Novosphingobium album (ex Hu et al. 2023)]
MAQVQAVFAQSPRRPAVIGLCGAQGSGKTTLARAVLKACEGAGLRAAVLSIDDLYLTLAERQTLARDVHPLLATRGVPGTHDVTLGLSVFAALDAGERVALPRFDKAHDDRAPQSEWPSSPLECNVLLFEGWCVGARPQARVDLLVPVNVLEASEDVDANWRTYVNDSLSTAYQTLFARIDRLILLAAPGFEVVQNWRLEQEHELAANVGKGGKVMDEASIARFVAHYERLTRFILQEMPGRADLVIRLDAARQPVEIRERT